MTSKYNHPHMDCTVSIVCRCMHSCSGVSNLSSSSWGPNNLSS